ncbi:MAG: HD domain-containing protein [Clostridia bacterium]|nr:HD domain-containing protein [Clostridia bacterium]
MLHTTAVTIITRLNKAGFEAFAVGGCVRDAFRGKIADDIDIATSARPEETMAVFADCRVIPTGVAHGTVTVLLDGRSFEITTYRTDGTYSDARHPDSVQYVRTLEEDLARRDFTVNAMAFHPTLGLIDRFGGMEDLHQKRLRCVGDPYKRFSEDALRIARLVRFMSVLGFTVEEETAAAAHALCNRLQAVAAERKQAEFKKMLTGDGFFQTATAFSDVLCELVPPLTPLVGFEQHSPHHDFDVYTHTVRAVHAAEKELYVRLAVLFHDLGKPDTFFTDEQGVGHFYGHPAVSETLAKDALAALRFDNATIQTVLPLVRYHDTQIAPTKRSVRRWLSRLGKENFDRLLAVKRADALGCKENSQAPDFSELQQVANDIVREAECFSLSSLAIGGNDLLALGYEASPAIGKILRELLDRVIDEQLPNDAAVLKDYVQRRWPHV